MSVADGAQSAPSAPQCPAVPFLDASLTEGGRQRLQEAAQEFLTEAKDQSEDDLTSQFLRVPFGLSEQVVVGRAEIARNRYSDIIPVADTRVVLKPQFAQETDYINANHIQPLRGLQRRYIAAQGPLPGTVDDFWHMVWGEASLVILMVARCSEGSRQKCAQYWPAPGSQFTTGGGVEVACKSEAREEALVVRHFQIAVGDEVRDVTQIHYTGWPDHGVPDDFGPIMRLLELVDKAERGHNDRPVVVHCSAGIGRTGTFIAIDMLRQQAAALLEDRQGVPARFNLPALLTALRKQRDGMIQMPGQYVWLWRFFVEYLRAVLDAL